MVADAFDDRGRARIAHAEAFTGAAGCEHASARGAVQDRVADDGVLVRSKQGHIRRHEHDLAAAHAFAQVVVGFAFEDQAHAVRREGAERLSRAAHHAHLEKWQWPHARQLLVGRLQTPRANLARDTRAYRAIAVPNDARSLESGTLGEDRGGVTQERLVEGLLFVGTVVACLDTASWLGAARIGIGEHGAEIDAIEDLGLPQQVDPADRLVDRAQAKAGEQRANLLGQVDEEVDDLLGRALELGA